MKEPKIIKGGIAVDDRGSVGFVNDFDFKDVKRFYMIQDHRAGFVRAWHGHRKEAKYFCATSGAYLICGVRIDDWDKPSKNLIPQRFVLSDKAPSILFIPQGYANGLMALTQDARVMVFSTASMEEAKSDDYRFEARLWDPWDIIER